MSETKLSDEVWSTVKAYRRRLEERFGDELLDVRVFGSYARGEQHEESDVDVFVLLRELDAEKDRAASELAAEAWQASGLFVAPLVFGEERFSTLRRHERRIAMDIEREGIVV